MTMLVPQYVPLGACSCPVAPRNARSTGYEEHKYHVYHSDVKVPTTPMPSYIDLPPVTPISSSHPTQPAAPSLWSPSPYRAHCVQPHVTSSTPPPWAKSATGLRTTYHPNRRNQIYPLNLTTPMSDLSNVQREFLCTKRYFRTPLHIHTPTAHIGIVLPAGPNGSNLMTAADIFMFLQSLAPLSPPRALQPPGRRSSPYDSMWEMKQAFITNPLGPFGASGPLFGNYNIWGIEDVSLQGYSVIHLA